MMNKPFVSVFVAAAVVGAATGLVAAERARLAIGAVPAGYTLEDSATRTGNKLTILGPDKLDFCLVGFRAGSEAGATQAAANSYAKTRLARDLATRFGRDFALGPAQPVAIGAVEGLGFDATPINASNPYEHQDAAYLAGFATPKGRIDAMCIAPKARIEAARPVFQRILHALLLP